MLEPLVLLDQVRRDEMPVARINLALSRSGRGGYVNAGAGMPSFGEPGAASCAKRTAVSVGR